MLQTRLGYVMTSMRGTVHEIIERGTRDILRLITRRGKQTGNY